MGREKRALWNEKDLKHPGMLFTIETKNHVI
jgi:hypothetical protein